MARQSKTGINETLSELLLYVLSGADYVSKLAAQTKKSIPVVYRQLDTLVTIGALEKRRRGKQVEYTVNWEALSDVIFPMLAAEKLFSGNEGSPQVKAEIKYLQKKLPKDVLENEQALKAFAKEFFANKKAVQLSQLFFGEINTSKMAFDKSIDMFLDTLGMLTEKEQKKLLAKLENASLKPFLQYCRLRYLQKQLSDPRRRFVDRLLS
jgi:DNA-binding transcriptional ArsR family regulator